jgi:signal transduction histidine kinase/CheY-like chemotaxis protein
VLRAVVVLSFLALMSLAALAAWFDRGLTLRSAQEHVALTVEILREHALNVFETQELVLDQIAGRSADLDWDAIRRSGDFAAFLRTTRDRMAYISSIWLADATGHIRAASGPFDPGEVVLEAAEARGQPGRDGGISVGMPRLGSFTLSERLWSPDGALRGVVAIETPVEYFASFFRGVGEQDGHRAVLLRADGTVLAADSVDREPRRFPANSELMRSIVHGVQLEVWVPVPGAGRHFFQWRQLASYPVYVAYAVDERVALRGWYARAVFYALLAAGIWATLWLIAHLSARRAAAEAALQEAQRMEAIGRLASGVAHDFNNLLTTVMGNVDRISSDQQSTPRVRRFAEAALDAARRGASLTTQLLAFARRQPLNPTLVRVSGLVEGMLPLIKDAIGEAITVTVAVDPELAAVRIDPGQFEEALLNLALNARDAMPQGGDLMIAARHAAVDAAEAARKTIAAGEYVVVEIADSGVGMRSEVMGRAFEPFFTTKETGKGTGLGLSMVYGFARQSGGTAEIESREGAGTTVRLYIPRSAESPAAAPPPRDDPPAGGRKAAVLVVEDQDGVRQLMAASLEECGHEVMTARTAEGAVDILKRETGIDVLVTDIVLPGGMTGADLVRKARELAPDLKVLTVSGNASDEAAIAVQNAGCAFLRKPFRPSELTRAVDELL